MKPSFFCHHHIIVLKALNGNNNQVSSLDEIKRVLKTLWILEQKLCKLLRNLTVCLQKVMD
ncbi:CLUMA_CG012797, isoform A [Clunio marinus]|uniref:CLUMA_CG012797, isoform A n=1 Tax=Clunio marinus TaxID=568069 RepID=A0A1J1IHS4_9DIPT|nr:CLUMA_CG012797, isoform A [Clunio marinus]